MKVKKSEKDDSIEEEREFDVEAGVYPEVDTQDVAPTEWVRHVVQYKFSLPPPRKLIHRCLAMCQAQCIA